MSRMRTNLQELLETVEAGWQINADENALHAAGFTHAHAYTVEHAAHF